MKPEHFTNGKEQVQWNLKINKEIDDDFKEFQDEYGKINRTQLVGWLIQQYMRQHKKEMESKK
jgi:hypothetical protein